MDTEKLNVLLQVLEHGSIQGAARKLGVTRSSLRRALEGLEADVGVPLLHRDTTGVRLTPAGSVLASQGRAVLDASRALLTDARAAAGEATGVIRVFEPVGLPLAIHVQALLAARMALPQQRIVLRHLEDPLTHLNEPFELMLHEGPPPDRGAWFSRVILRASTRLIASRAYLERRGTPQHPAELCNHDTLGWKRPGIRADEWPLLAGGHVTVTPWLTSSEPHLLSVLMAEGAGILLAARTPFFDPPSAEPPVTVLEDQVGGELVLRVSTPFPTRTDSRTRDTLKMLLELLDGLPQD